ncbi:AAA family ATPase [Photobacterium toruni]|uniref:Recombination protein F n=1 Tax=Photobacterium toruni TaxID=1935446 RepID=A0A1T4TU05_9GAMM|nr:AAA family ATPase [Photobacterium toruni]SKA43937.1 recombination protein F [Photobacterium toruni]
MKIKALTLKNFRGFKEFECTFKPSINVLVGLNGFGKSSLLDAITVAYGQFMSGFGISTDRAIRDNDIHLGKISTGEHGFTMESQFPVVVSAQSFGDYVDDFPIEWSRARNTQKSTGTKVPELVNVAKRLQKIVQDGAFPNLPVIACYGTNRLWNQSFDTSNDMPKLGKMSRLEGYRDWDKPSSGYKTFANWLYQETMASFEQSMKQQQQRMSGNLVSGNVHEAHLNALQKAINAVLEPSGWSNVHYSATEKQVVATHEVQGNVPISLLSDGVRNMIGMVADIARRAIQLNPHQGDHVILEAHGIVLIDEVDMHLHPQWQRHILGGLQKAFPNIQFIVTTHSPLVISDIKNVHVNLLDNPEKASQVPDLYGQDANSVLLEIMDTDIRNAEVNEKLGDVLDAIHNSKNTKDIAKAKELLVVLDGDLPVSNLELSKAKLLLRKKELKIAQNN